MKRVMILLTVMVITICSFAQDIIVTKDAKKIDAKILEVSTSEIRYKELDNLDGPVFILRADEIVTIIYANGKVVLYNQETEQETREAAEAERKAKEAEAIADANKFGSLFGNTGNTTGSGDSQGLGQKGQPIGHGSRGTASWSLAGRGIKGTLPQPANTFNQEGRVIVEIRVNAAGKVVSAVHKGGNVNDKATIQLALDAAKKAKFTEGDHDQIGTITYNFKFN